MERMNVSFEFTEFGNKRYICIYLDQNVPMYFEHMYTAKACIWYQTCSSPLVSKMPFDLGELLFTSHSQFLSKIIWWGIILRGNPNSLPIDEFIFIHIPG